MWWKSKITLFSCSFALLMLALFPFSQSVKAQQTIDTDGFIIQADRVEGTGMYATIVKQETSQNSGQPMLQFHYQSATIYGLRITKQFNTGNGMVSMTLKANGPVTAKGMTVDTTAMSFKGACINAGQTIPELGLENVTMVAHFMQADENVINQLFLDTVSGNGGVVKPDNLQILKDLSSLPSNVLTEQIAKITSGHLPLTCEDPSKTGSTGSPVNLTGITQPLGTVVGQVTQPLGGVIGQVTQPLGGVLGQVTQPLGGVLGQVTQPLGGVLGQVTQPLGSVLSQVNKPLDTVVTQVTQPLGTAVNQVTKPLAPVVTQVTQPVKPVVTQVTKPLEPVVTQVTKPSTPVLEPLKPVTQATSGQDSKASAPETSGNTPAPAQSSTQPSPQTVQSVCDQVQSANGVIDKNLALGLIDQAMSKNISLDKVCPSNSSVTTVLKNWQNSLFKSLGITGSLLGLLPVDPVQQLPKMRDFVSKAQNGAIVYSP